MMDGRQGDNKRSGALPLLLVDGNVGFIRHGHSSRHRRRLWQRPHHHVMTERRPLRKLLLHILRRHLGLHKRHLWLCHLPLSLSHGYIARLWWLSIAKCRRQTLRREIVPRRWHLTRTWRHRRGMSILHLWRHWRRRLLWVLRRQRRSNIGGGQAHSRHCLMQHMLRRRHMLRVRHRATRHHMHPRRHSRSTGHRGHLVETSRGHSVHSRHARWGQMVHRLRDNKIFIFKIYPLCFGTECRKSIAKTIQYSTKEFTQ